MPPCFSFGAPGTSASVSVERALDPEEVHHVLMSMPVSLFFLVGDEVDRPWQSAATRKMSADARRTPGRRGKPPDDAARTCASRATVPMRASRSSSDLGRTSSGQGTNGTKTRSERPPRRTPTWTTPRIRPRITGRRPVRPAAVLNVSMTKTMIEMYAHPETQRRHRLQGDHYLQGDTVHPGPDPEELGARV